MKIYVTESLEKSVDDEKLQVVQVYPSKVNMPSYVVWVK